MNKQHILQVSELTKKVRFMLESELNTVWLCGEVSNFVNASSGHWYLSLKDKKSQVRCAMFKGNNQRVRLGGQRAPSNGQQVLVRAKVSLYEPRGDFQLIIESMEDAGEGLLRQAYEQLKNKLNLQGLFNQAHKKNIPPYIKTLGVVTSPTGAAIKDILTVLKRRNPNINVIIYPALVQGEQAKFDITQAINIANVRNECDVLIVGRGGGSLEDLWPFNEENVVQAIHASEIPVISAVGHEIDTTLSDYVADLRAPTPSAAAELVSDDISVSLAKITTHEKQLLLNTKRSLQAKNTLVANLTHRLLQFHPEQQLHNQQQRADELHARLARVILKESRRFQSNKEQLAKRLQLFSPLKAIKLQNKALAQYHKRLHSSIKYIHHNKSQAFVSLIDQLNLVSPLATISRGYSVLRNNNDEVITKIDKVEIDESITIQVSDGTLKAQIKDKTPHVEK